MANELMARFMERRGQTPDEAGFFWTGGPVEVAERVWFASMFSGVTVFETDDGLVLVDSGLAQMGPTLAQLIRGKTDKPVHTAIFTHGHVDHAYGLPAFLAPGQPRPRVVAHRAIEGRFARYEATAAFNAAINARQFGGRTVTRDDATFSGSSFSRPPIAPDTLIDERLTLSVGGLSFEIHHCRGETDDQCWVWCPERRVLCTGDLIINAAPNAGNPQKVQRYPWEWAKGLREMAALEPASLCPGHGGPVVQDAAKARRILLETADYLDALVSGTLAAMNAGAPPHADIVHRVAIPQSASPWLRAMYDDPEFIIRTVIRHFGGWWNGRPGDLKPAPRRDLAREIAALAGGAARLAERATELAAAGDLRLATQLADYALEAAEDDETVRAATASVYEARARSETSLMAENIFATAAGQARAGKAFD